MKGGGEGRGEGGKGLLLKKGKKKGVTGDLISSVQGALKSELFNMFCS